MASLNRSFHSLPAGESREGPALFGGGTGGTPSPYPPHFPPGKHSESPAGESREGPALCGGGTGGTPSPYPPRFPPGKWADILRIQGEPN